MLWQPAPPCCDPQDARVTQPLLASPFPPDVLPRERQPARLSPTPRAPPQVLHIDLQRKLYPLMKDIKPLPSIYDPQAWAPTPRELPPLFCACRLAASAQKPPLTCHPRPQLQFIAANQKERADNVIKGTRKQQMEQVKKDVVDFKAKHGLDQVVVLWTANTERYTDVTAGVHDTEENFRAAVERNEAEISPSSLFALACIDIGVPFINGAPQNTFVPGVMEAAIRLKSLIGGDDFKSGQTKMKSVLVDFLVRPPALALSGPPAPRSAPPVTRAPPPRSASVRSL